VTDHYGVQCWGRNDHGQLGDGTLVDRSFPVRVVGISSADVVSISLGSDDSCAVLHSGEVRCWGSNDHGQLGDGTTTDRATPVVVAGLDGAATSVTAAGSHTCALVTGGVVECWGANDRGQLGTQTGGGDALSPVTVPGLTSVRAISAGGDDPCVITGDRTVECWGANDRGQLGDGTNNDSADPVVVSGLANVIAIRVGGIHTCAIVGSNPSDTDGGVKCWGANDRGQLGDSSFVDRSSPVDVSGLASGVIQLWSTDLDTCAVMTTGAVQCWGADDQGLLGDGSATDQPSPVLVGGVAHAVQIAVSDNHVCELNGDGSVDCWGLNVNGELGDGTLVHRASPVPVVGLGSGVVQFAIGFRFACGLSAVGGVSCWGDDSFGELGDGSSYGADGTRTLGQNVELTPVQVVGLESGVLQISGNSQSVCARTAEAVYCWGSMTTGWVGGQSDISPIPVQVPGLGATTSLSVESNTACASVADGSVSCWGAADGVVIPVMPNDHHSTPTPQLVLPAGSGVESVHLIGSAACVIETGGRLMCWGDNSEGELGDGSTTSSTTPQQVIGLESGVASFDRQCALTVDGSVKCWGDNTLGTLGDGSGTGFASFSTSPVQVSGLDHGVSAITGTPPGGAVNCALVADGQLECWGAVSNIGLPGASTGPLTGSASTVPQAADIGALSTIALGSENTACAVTRGGDAECWGPNNSGQLGDGTTTDRLIPGQAALVVHW
jgi:alpha-tubulin suppressor-like RCC1 family protein